MNITGSTTLAELRGYCEGQGYDCGVCPFDNGIRDECYFMTGRLPATWKLPVSLSDKSAHKAPGKSGQHWYFRRWLRCLNCGGREDDA